MCVLGGDSSKFDVLIDGKLLKSEALQAAEGDASVKVGYDIPPDLVSGKKRVAVMFRAKANKPTAELYELAVVRPER